MLVLAIAVRVGESLAIYRECVFSSTRFTRYLSFPPVTFFSRPPFRRAKLYRWEKRMSHGHSPSSANRIIIVNITRARCTNNWVLLLSYSWTSRALFFSLSFFFDIRVVESAAAYGITERLCFQSLPLQGLSAASVKFASQLASRSDRCSRDFSRGDSRRAGRIFRLRSRESRRPFANPRDDDDSLRRPRRVKRKRKGTKRKERNIVCGLCMVQGLL